MTPLFNRRKPRILIVDDEPANVDVLRRVLSGAGLGKISVTTDSTKAAEVFLAETPDLVILDLHMPVMDGFDVLAALKHACRGGHFPCVLMISGDSNAATRQRALASGAKDFITKPFDLHDVRLRIANLLETTELQLALREQNAVLEATLRHRTVELEEARIESVERLALVAELRDDVTGQHNARVARMASAIAEAIGPRSSSAELLGRVAALHDIGKIGIPDSVLLKTGPLSPSEWETMKTHTTIGARILSSGKSEFMHLAREIAQSHHERWDGGGYPEGLAGTRIPLAARIVSIADVFDALSSDRPYRPAYPISDACAAIERGSGTLFDPSLVDVFRTISPPFRSRGDFLPARAGVCKVRDDQYHSAPSPLI